MTLRERIAELKARMDGPITQARLAVIVFDLLTLVEELAASLEEAAP